MLDINNVKFYTYCRFGNETKNIENQEKQEKEEKSGKRYSKKLFRKSASK